jgi:hypothetical protein
MHFNCEDQYVILNENIGSPQQDNYQKVNFAGNLFREDLIDGLK